MLRTASASHPSRWVSLGQQAGLALALSTLHIHAQPSVRSKPPAAPTAAALSLTHAHAHAQGPHPRALPPPHPHTHTNAHTQAVELLEACTRLGAAPQRQVVDNLLAQLQYCGLNHAPSQQLPSLLLALVKLGHNPGPAFLLHYCYVSACVCVCGGGYWG